MAITFTFPTSATLAGARDVSRSFRAANQEDMGFKIEVLISNMNTLNTIVSDLTSALLSANASGVTVSVLSGYLTSTGVQMSNFRA